LTRNRQIRAIETEYKGYLFRSRLEARWAVFFDTLHIEWEYEKEGYILPGLRIRYLPDFWLPQVAMWAEVKPTPLSGIEKLKCKKLCIATGHPVLMLDGMPKARNYWAYETEYSFDGSERELSGEITYNDYALMDQNRYWEYEARFYTCTGPVWPGVQNCYAYGHSIDCICNRCDAFGAIRSARQARFEHGETPRMGELRGDVRAATKER
jgi:hypothetical protein